MFMTLIAWGNATKKIYKKNKNIKFNSWSFSLTFVNLYLAWMLYFYECLQNKGKFLVRSEYYNQFGIYQPSRVS